MESLFIAVIIICLFSSNCSAFTHHTSLREKISLREMSSLFLNDRSCKRCPLVLFDTSTTASSDKSRRSFITDSFAAATFIGSTFSFRPHQAIAETDIKLADVLAQVKDARGQMDDIPDLIKAEKWDAVRAILVKPPLSNMWTSGGQNKLLNNYADAIGNEVIDGDEIAALELREDIISHLRYLDMAVYNNVFNPIATEGENGATKELVRSYYEDPINEYKASKSAIDQLIDLAR